MYDFLRITNGMELTHMEDKARIGWQPTGPTEEDHPFVDPSFGVVL